MKILVQDPNSREYLTQNQEWSARAVEAKAFNNPEHAAHFAKWHTFRDFEVVIYLSHLNVSLPIFSAGVWTVPKPAPAPMKNQVPESVS